MSNPQQQIAEFVSGADIGWSKPAEHAVLLALVDTLAVALAARGEPALRRVLDYAHGLHETAAAPVWGESQGFAPETAALVNGVAAHVLDYDDVAAIWRGHPSGVLFPALLALPEMQTASGDDLTDAYAVGFEIGGRLGETCAQTQYTMGWHTTATIGVLAATVACCRALRLDAQSTSSAIGLAVAQAAGPQANFGTMAKPLHAGFAASAAVRAARLAAHGIEASSLSLTGSGGFIDLYGGAALAPALRGLGQDAPIVAGEAIERKLSPICYAAHRGMEALRLLKQKHALAAAAIRSIDVEGSAGSHKALLARTPANGTEAKFSLEYAMALLLVDGTIGLDSFSEAALARQDVRAMMSRIGLTESRGLVVPRWSRVRVRLHDGRVYERTVERISPDQSNALLLGKIVDCLAFGGRPALGRALYEDVLALPGRPIATLLQSLARLSGRGAATSLRPRLQEIAPGFDI